MKRNVLMLIGIAFLASGAGCKGRGHATTLPPITLTASVTVVQNGIKQVNVAVVESQDYNMQTSTPLNPIQTVNTDSTGVATFSTGNPNAKYCFSVNAGQFLTNYVNCQNPLTITKITLGT
ncbi:MAG: hypothetical protein NVSMB31_10190 [Vulcanimicrobiaceae bacterium]